MKPIPTPGISPEVIAIFKGKKGVYTITCKVCEGAFMTRNSMAMKCPKCKRGRNS